MDDYSYRTVSYDRLDKICYGFYGTSSNRIVEIVLDRNPGLEQHAFLLPAGITVKLPPRKEVVADPPRLPSIKLL